MHKRNVAILLFDQVEVLDFAGPFEVFSVTDELNGDAPFNVFTVAEEERVVHAVGGLKVVPTYSFPRCPHPDILVVPGGAGSRNEMENEDVVQWVQEVHEQAELVMSVCSGARILAKAGLLSRLPVTTHHEVVTHLKELVPDAEIREKERFVDTGKIITTGGISAGIDGAFHVITRLLGEAVARRTAAYMEFDGYPQNL